MPVDEWREYEEGVLERREAERNGDHVDDAIDRLIHGFVPEDDDERGRILQHFLDDYPYKNEVVTTESLKRKFLKGALYLHEAKTTAKKERGEIRRGVRVVRTSIPFLGYCTTKYWVYGLNFSRSKQMWISMLSSVDRLILDILNTLT